MTSNFSGGEIRLGSGQRAKLDEGTVKIVPPELPPEPQQFHFCMNVACGQDTATAVMHVYSGTYSALVAFLNQLEAIDYSLINIERIEGAAATPSDLPGWDPDTF